MKEFWQLWLGLWLGVPNRERTVSSLWDMPTKAKSRYTNMQKNTDTKQTSTDTPSGFLKRGFVLGEPEKKKKQVEYAHIQPQIASDTKHLTAEKITAVQKKTKYQQPIQRTIFYMAEPSEQKQTVLFSAMSKQAPKQQEQNIVTKMGVLQQEKVSENKQQNEKKLMPFLHIATYRDSMGQVQQREQPSAIWKQQGEDVVMLQKILRYYENQQNGAVGNQNVSIQIGHIKQQADVDDVMEALTKKLWEARSITTKKAKGGVSHG